MSDPGSAKGGAKRSYRCQVLWHIFTKSPPLCSEVGQPAFTNNPNTGLFQGVNTSSPANSHQSSNWDRDQIREVQSKLNSLGYSVGPEDGLLGSKTVDALNAFQRNQGIPETGVADQQTLDALKLATTSQNQ